MFNRGATLVVGNYRDNAMPSHDYIVLPKLHGFDAYFECIATCEEGVIIINYNGYIPNQLVISNRIIARKVDNGTYQKLRQDSNSTLIQAY